MNDVSGVDDKTISYADALYRVCRTVMGRISSQLSDCDRSRAADWLAGAGFADPARTQSAKADRPILLTKFEAALAKFAAERLDAALGPAERPDGPGNMRYSEAAYWIASDRGRLKASDIDSKIWQSAYRELNDRIISKGVTLFGRRTGKGAPEKIQEVYQFSSVPIELPLSGDPFVRDGAPYVLCRLGRDEDHWELHFNDHLKADWRSDDPLISHLEVDKSDIAAFWPTPSSTESLQRTCERLLIREMQASPRQKLKSKETLEAEMCALIPGLGNNQFDRAWDVAVKQTGAIAWSKAGRLKAVRAKI
jgi:hypothetical protein